MKCKYFFLLGCLLGCVACQYNPIERFNDYMGWQDDNIAEEAVEFVIEKESGVDLDLSPRSPE